MENLILKIKSYQEEVTYLTFSVPAHLSNEQLKNIALNCKKIVDESHKTMIGSPNLIRFENNQGIYSKLSNQIIMK